MLKAVIGYTHNKMLFLPILSTKKQAGFSEMDPIELIKYNGIEATKTKVD